MRNMGRAFALAVAVLAVTVNTAGAADFGGWQATPATSGGQALYGTRADIKLFTSSNDAAALLTLSRVYTEKVVGSQVGIIQAGRAKLGPIVNFNQCAAGPSVTFAFWEYKALGTTTPLICGVVNGLNAAVPTRFAAIRASSGAGGRWAAYIAGTERVNVDVGWNESDLVGAGVEASNGTASPYNMDGCWGCDGSLRWQRKLTATGGTYSTISTAARRLTIPNPNPRLFFEREPASTAGFRVRISN